MSFITSNSMTDILNIHYRGRNFFLLMSRYSKALVSKVESCGLKKIFGWANNKGKIDNN